MKLSDQIEAYIQWCITEQDLSNPWHDAPDLDDYTTGDYVRPGQWTANLFALMCDAQQWMNRDGSIVSLIR